MSPKKATRDLTSAQWDRVEAAIRVRMSGDREIETLDGASAREVLREAAGRWSSSRGEHIDPTHGWDSEIVAEVKKLFDLRRRQRKMLSY